jgi:hypothetical protein
MVVSLDSQAIFSPGVSKVASEGLPTIEEEIGNSPDQMLSKAELNYIKPSWMQTPSYLSPLSCCVDVFARRGKQSKVNEKLDVYVFGNIFHTDSGKCFVQIADYPVYPFLRHVETCN